MKLIQTVGSLLVLGCLAEAAHAEKNRGFYIEGQYAPRTSYDLGPRPPTIGTVTIRDDDTDSGYMVGAGYGFNEYFSVGAAWVDLGRVSRVATDSANNTTTTVSASVDGFAVYAQGHVPVGQNFYLMGKLGYMDADISLSSNAPFLGSVSGSDSGAVAGLGGGYYFNDNFAITAEWSRYQVADDVDYFGIGAKFSF